MTRDEFLANCAGALQALINSKAASPSQDEIKAMLATELNRTKTCLLQHTSKRMLDVPPWSFERDICAFMVAHGFVRRNRVDVGGS